MDACSLLCAPTLGRSVRHGQIIRSRAVWLSSRCSSSNTAGDSNGHSHAIGCFMLSLMLALNRALTDWHDNSPFNSPPPLTVALSLPSLHLLFHLLILSFIILSLSLCCHLDSSPSHFLAGTLPLSCPRRDSPDGPLAPPPPLICSDPCSFSREKKISPSRGPAAGHNPRPVGRCHWAIQRCMQHAACTRHAPRAA
ncbi:hypothetical protein V8C43DRAFT_277581 [Trichoderma afarasin]